MQRVELWGDVVCALVQSLPFYAREKRGGGWGGGWGGFSILVILMGELLSMIFLLYNDVF